ncbi:Capn15, partial [Symbiodinium sp. CCMP2592]
MPRPRGRRGGKNRNKRGRDFERERARPPKSRRADLAAVSSESSESDMEPPAEEPAASSRHVPTPRPITLYARPADLPAHTPARAPVEVSDEAPVSGGSASSIMPTGGRDQRADFSPEALRRELPPDEFLALASLMGRDYATPTQTSYRGVASKWMVPRATGVSARAEDAAPARVASMARTWPAGALGPKMSVDASAVPPPRATPVTVTDSAATASEGTDDVVMVLGGVEYLRPLPKRRPQSQRTHQLPPLISPQENAEIEASMNQGVRLGIADLGSMLPSASSEPVADHITDHNAYGSSQESNIQAPRTPPFLEADLLLRIELKNQAAQMIRDGELSADGSGTPPDPPQDAAAPAVPVLCRLVSFTVSFTPHRLALATAGTLEVEPTTGGDGARRNNLVPKPRHLKILTWNAGGLGGKEGALFDELQVYANTHPFDVLLVQESKWTFSNMWEDPRWFFLHSGSTARDFKQGGVLIMLSKRIVDPGSVRFVEPLPGRILWAHFTHRGRPIDILNMYQHTWRGSERVAQLRHRALDVLTKSVQAVSLRSVLIVAGDFNAQCDTSLPH